MDILGKLFGGQTKVKIMRLFLFNPDRIYDAEDIVIRSCVTPREATNEIDTLRKVGLIKRRAFFKVFDRLKRGKVLSKKKKILGWKLDQTFPYLKQLQNLLISTILIRDNEIVRRISKAGHIKLLIASGIFIQDLDSRVDLLIVGDNIKRGVLERTIRNMEAEIGKELRYAYFETTAFNYRLNVYDKLIRDILDYDHSTLIDKVGLVLPR